MTDIPKTYDPTQIEPKWYQYWEEHDLFNTDPASGKQAYCIMMPPPNVTGELHMGHALQDSMQDMLIRLKRMQGYEALWQPGKDHAGIATQNVVEKTLAKEGVKRQDLGREKFLEKVWEWVEKYGNRIFQQKKLLGDSADWSRERFTLDDGLSDAVAKVFKHLYDKGLIYQGHYIVNWCPRCRTAISDEEVNHQDHDHHLWHFRYPFKDGSGHVVVATTRPETMLGDTAVAVNPSDERMTDLVGKKLILPLMDREIPVIADEYVDPAFGTGQVKVTPAHDPNDFEMGKRHSLPEIIVMDEEGVMNENAGRFKGLDRFEARKQVVAALDEAGLLDRVEDYKTSVGHCSRCKTVIEPYLSKQWFVKMKPLAEPALEVVRQGNIKFHPQRWEKVYYGWLENIRDWCISRQLWWGHRIPVWYCNDCDEIMVDSEAPPKCKSCGSSNLRQDEDVLDTWFSSWLWPFSTLGWPDDDPARKFWYPTDVMVTGYDIIFFWVARMIMAGIEFMGEIPFSDVYITGMIKDEQGRWMSKSLGNGIDPAEMVEQYGADAVRYTLITLATEGQDINLTPSRFEGGRNFTNKLWNAYRFLMTHVDKLPEENRAELGKYPLSELPSDAPLVDRWIVSRLSATVAQVHQSADRFRLYECLSSQYEFLWREFCDWYLELIKNRLSDDVPAFDRQLTLEVAVLTFEAAMRLLHPGMPFITEEIWQGLHRSSDDRSIMISDYPKVSDFPSDPSAEADIALLQDIISAVRNIRSEMLLPPTKKADLILNNVSKDQTAIISRIEPDLKRLAAIDNLSFDTIVPKQVASAVVGEIEIFVPLAGLIDIDVERNRLDKEIGRLEGLIRAANGKLSNDKFVNNAPAEVVAHEREKLANCEEQLAKVQRNRSQLD